MKQANIKTLNIWERKPERERERFVIVYLSFVSFLFWHDKMWFSSLSSCTVYVITINKRQINWEKLSLTFSQKLKFDSSVKLLTRNRLKIKAAICKDFWNKKGNRCWPYFQFPYKKENWQHTIVWQNLRQCVERHQQFMVKRKRWRQGAKQITNTGKQKQGRELWKTKRSKM